MSRQQNDSNLIARKYRENEGRGEVRTERTKEGMGE